MSDFTYCYGIGPGHQPCLVRWHACQANGEEFLPVETPNEPAV